MTHEMIERPPVLSRFVRPGIAVLIGALATTCTLQPEGEPEALSFAGDPLYAPPLSKEQREQREAELEKAREAYDRDPQDADAIIWLGRRTAYLGRYREAIEIYSRGLKQHPDEPRLLR